MSDDALSSSVVKLDSARELLCAVQESAGAKSMMMQLKKGNVSPMAQDLISRLLHPRAKPCDKCSGCLAEASQAYEAALLCSHCRISAIKVPINSRQ